MSWLQKLLPPKIKRGDTSARNKSIPEGLWSKCDGCESVLYRSDLEGNLSVCPKCGHHKTSRQLSSFSASIRGSSGSACSSGTCSTGACSTGTCPFA